MANAEFIPNQIITFGSELLDERNCNNSLDKYPMPLIQDGDELKFQFKRGSCQDDISYVKPCEPPHDPEAENILAGKKRFTIYIDSDYSSVYLGQSFSLTLKDVNNNTLATLLTSNIAPGQPVLSLIATYKWYIQTVMLFNYTVHFENEVVDSDTTGHIDFYILDLADQRATFDATTGGTMIGIDNDFCCSSLVFYEGFFNNSRSWNLPGGSTISGGNLTVAPGATVSANAGSVYPFDANKIYCVLINVTSSDANIDVRIAGNNFANIATTGASNKQLFFTVKKFLSNDLQIENLSGSGTGVVVKSIFIREVCENVIPDLGYNKWWISSGMIYKLPDGQQCVLTYPTVDVNKTIKYQYRVAPSSFSGAMNINIFGYDYTETAATAIVEKVITAVNDMVIISGAINDTFQLNLFDVSAESFTDNIRVLIFDTQYIEVANLTNQIMLLGEYVNVIVDIASLEIPYGCYFIEVNVCNTPYYSNYFDYREEHECTKLVTGSDTGYSLGFLFDGGFNLQARVKCLSINPKFPIRQSTKLYSDGVRARGFGERDEVWEALFDVYGAAEYRTLSAMLLCDTFKIDGKEWFFEGKELNPIWDKEGKYDVAQCSIELFKQATIFKGGCGAEDVIPVNLCDGKYPIPSISGDTVGCAGIDMNLILSDSGPRAGGGRYKLYNPNGEEIYANDGPSIYTLINPYREMTGIFTLKITYVDGCSATTEQFIQVFTGFNSVTVIDVIHPTVGNSDGGFTVLVTQNTDAGPPYGFTLIDPYSENYDGVFSGLPAGTYTIYIVDTNGCQYNFTYTLTEI